MAERTAKRGDAVHIEGFMWRNPATRQMEQDYRGMVIFVDYSIDPSDPTVNVQFENSKRIGEYDMSVLRDNWDDTLNTFRLHNWA